MSKTGSILTEEHLETTLEQLPVNVQIINRDGRTVRVNKKFEQTFGVDADVLMSKGYNFFKDRNLIERGIASAVRRVFNGEKVEMPVINFDAVDQITGEKLNHLVRIEAFPIIADNNITHVGLIYDNISEKVDLQKSLIEKNKELETFVYTVSHDLKSPLSVITSCVDILRDIEPDEFITKQLDMIMRSSIKMKDFIDSILALSRAGREDEARPYKTPITIIAKSLYQDLQTANPGVKMEITVEKMPEVEIHPNDTSQLLQNLIWNSFKYRDKTKKLKINIGHSKISSGLRFHVEDNGLGIGLSEQEKIFSIFYRGSSSCKHENIDGTGVGLAICKKIIDKAGGKIWVESEEGKGSKFYFTVPD
jgi:PAS domain S-box-containing protein